jgi:hypothetical protein
MMKKILFMLIALLIFGAAQAHGADIITLEKGLVHIAFSEYDGFDDIVVRVLRQGKTGEDLRTAADMMEIIAYQQQVQTDIAGSGEVSFYLDTSAIYTIEIASATGLVHSYMLEYTGPEHIREIISLMNEAILSEDFVHLQTLVETHYDALTLNAHVYEKYMITAPGGELLYPMLKGSTIDSPEKLEASLNGCALVVMMKNTDAANGLSMLEEHADEAGFASLGAYKAYILSDYKMLRSSVVSQFIAANHDTLNQAKEEFARIVLTTGLKNSFGSELVKKLISLTSDYTGIDLSACEKLNAPEKVYLALQGLNAHHISDVKDAFDQAYEKQRLAELTAGPGSGSGSGGGFGGSGGSSATAGYEHILPMNVVSSENEAKTHLFDDIDGVPWAQESIIRLFNAKIISGRLKGHFEPNAPITREEFVKIIVLALGQHSADAACDFSDVKESDWFYSYVASGVNNNLIKGTGNNAFGVGLNIKREDMAVIIYRILGAGKSDLPSGFSDLHDISPYAMEAVNYVQQVGIIQGMADNTFQPHSDVTRAQAAVVTDRLLKYLDDGEVIG